MRVNRFYYFRFIVFVIVSGLISARSFCQEKQQKIDFPKAAQNSSTKLIYKIIDAPQHTFCYDIYREGKLIIHQPSAPALPGNEGFKTKTGAEKVAKLVIKKINKEEMPPTVSIEEMKKLKAIN